MFHHIKKKQVLAGQEIRFTSAFHITLSIFDNIFSELELAVLKHDGHVIYWEKRGRYIHMHAGAMLTLSQRILRPTVLSCQLKMKLGY